MSSPTRSRIPPYRPKLRTPLRAPRTSQATPTAIPTPKHNRPYTRQPSNSALVPSPPRLNMNGRHTNRHLPKRSPFAKYRSSAPVDTHDELPYDNPRSTADYPRQTLPSRFAMPDRNRSLSSRLFRTPERPQSRGERGSLANARPHTPLQEPVFDETLIEKTPAKGENDQWLASLGFDLSLLTLTDNNHHVENQNPNLSIAPHPAPDFEKLSPTQAPVLDPLRPPICLSQNILTDAARRPDPGVPRPTALRRHTDLNARLQADMFAETADPVTPSRLGSARKGRRASARVSARELRGLLDVQEAVENAKEIDLSDMRKSARKARNRRSMRLQLGPVEMGGLPVDVVEPTGATVMLSPVRATREQKEALGSENIVTPVRRSLRISQRHAPAIPFPDLGGQNAERLDSANYAYLPNPSLEGKLANEIRTPLR